MANPTTNYAFAMPTNTDLVKDLPADFEIFGQAVDTQMKTNADAAIAKTIVDAKGDIIAATAADTVDRLAVGANDTVLTADSTAATGLKWAAPASGGMTLLSTTTLSGATTTVSSINQTYNSLYVVVQGVTNASSNGNLYIRPNGNSGITSRTIIWSTSLEMIEGGDPFFNWDAQKPTRTSANNIWVLQIDNYASTTRYKGLTFHGTYERGGPNQTAIGGFGGIGTNSAITSLVFDQDGGDFTAGTVLVYGVK